MNGKGRAAVGDEKWEAAIEGSSDEALVIGASVRG